jgi:uncharacterized protein
VTRFATQRVRATPKALELIDALREIHGPITLFRSGGRHDEAAVICLTRAELLPSDDDIKLGEIGGAPFYVDAEGYQGCGRPVFVIDVVPGAAGGLPLAGLEEVHFVTRRVSVDVTAQPA